MHHILGQQEGRPLGLPFCVVRRSRAFCAKAAMRLTSMRGCAIASTGQFRYFRRASVVITGKASVNEKDPSGKRINDPACREPLLPPMFDLPSTFCQRYPAPVYARGVCPGYQQSANASVQLRLHQPQPSALAAGRLLACHCSCQLAHQRFKSFHHEPPVLPGSCLTGSSFTGSCEQYSFGSVPWMKASIRDFGQLSLASLPVAGSM